MVWRGTLLVLLCIAAVNAESEAGAAAAAAPAAASAPRSRLAGKDMTALKGRGWGSDRSDGALDFVEFLSPQAVHNIEIFDSLAKGLDMTLEDFFMFINKLLEEGVPDEDDEEENADGLTVKQLGELFGGVNATAVSYILDTLGVTAKELHAGFNTVDVVMVLMFVSSHLEAGGVPLSIMDIISFFCNPKTGQLDSAVWAANVAKAKGVPQAKVHRLMRQLEGGVEDIMTYVEEVVKPDTCQMVSKRPPAVQQQPVPLQAPRAGNLRGAASQASAVQR